MFLICLAVLSSEYCYGYTDKFGKWNNGFPCPSPSSGEPVYCCGTSSEPYCCRKKEDDPPRPAHEYVRAEASSPTWSQNRSRVFMTSNYLYALRNQPDVLQKHGAFLFSDVDGALLWSKFFTRSELLNAKTKTKMQMYYTFI